MYNKLVPNLLHSLGVVQVKGLVDDRNKGFVCHAGVRFYSTCRFQTTARVCIGNAEKICCCLHFLKLLIRGLLINQLQLLFGFKESRVPVFQVANPLLERPVEFLGRSRSLGVHPKRCEHRSAPKQITGGPFLGERPSKKSNADETQFDELRIYLLPSEAEVRRSALVSDVVVEAQDCVHEHRGVCLILKLKTADVVALRI